MADRVAGQHEGHGCQAEGIERAVAARDAAIQVGTEAFRNALTEQVYDNGDPIGSLAELAHVDVAEQANFQIQGDIADALRRWLVPPSQRPTCPLNGQPCTSWTCLVDVCVDDRRAAI